MCDYAQAQVNPTLTPLKRDGAGTMTLLNHKDEITTRFGAGFWTEVVDRMVATTSYPREHCEKQLDECLAYLLARAAMDDPNAALVCNLEPDLAWHSFLLYTDEYTSFCRDIAGTYLRHDPAGESALVNTPEATARTIAMFRRHDIRYRPALWQDHITYPLGAEVTPIRLLPRVAAALTV